MKRCHVFLFLLEGRHFAYRAANKRLTAPNPLEQLLLEQAYIDVKRLQKLYAPPVPMSIVTDERRNSIFIQFLRASISIFVQFL